MLNSTGTLYFTLGSGSIMRLSPNGEVAEFLPPIVTNDSMQLVIAFLVVDSSDNLYVGGELDSNTSSLEKHFGFFQVTPSAEVRELARIDEISGINLRGVTSGAVDQYGNLFVSGYVSDTIIRIGTDGPVVEYLSGPTLSGNIHFDSPRSLLMDAEDNLYIAATGSDNLIRVSSMGEITALAIGEIAFDGRSFSSPYSVSINQFGELLVSSVRPDGGAYLISANDQITRVLSESGDGTGFVHTFGRGLLHGPAEFIGEAFISAGRTAVDSEGNFYVVGQESDNIFRIGRDGSLTTIIGTTKNTTNLIDGPRGLVIDQDNNLYVTSAFSANIVKIEDSLSIEYSPSDCTKASALESVTDTFNCIPSDADLPVFRFYNSRDNAFFYTSTWDEAAIVIANSSSKMVEENRWPYTYQGSTFSAAYRYSGTVPLYRFYNYSTGHHFFTASEEEKSYVLQQISESDWPFNYEGVAFQVYLKDPTPDFQGSEVPVFRFYSGSLNRHFYTANPIEAEVLNSSTEWGYEGIGFYGESH